MRVTCSLLILIVFTTGCSGLSIAEFQDAETLEPGSIEFLYGQSTGPDYASIYSDSSLKRFPATSLQELRINIGVNETVELGFAIWSGHILQNVIFNNDDHDAGIKAGLKYMLTPREAEHKFAVSATGGGYFAENKTFSFGNPSIGGGGVSGALFYTYVIDPSPEDGELDGFHFSAFRNIRNFYLGAKINRWVIDVTRTQFVMNTESRESVHKKVNFYNLFTGLSFGSHQTQYFEVDFTILKNPNTRKLERIISASAAFGFNFGK